MARSVYIFFTLFIGYGNLIVAQPIDSTYVTQHYHSNVKFVYAASLMIIGGIILNGNGEEGFKKEIAEERNEHYAKFGTKVDNYLQFSPIGIAYGLDALGYKSKTDLPNRTVILLKGELLMTGLVYSIKKITHQLRPDNSGNNSFPSGHTAQAFAAAIFLSEEYKDKSRIIPYLAYGLATSVGILRIANNKHYISDVLVGAGFGILSMKVAYLTHKYKWNKKYIKSQAVF